MKYIGNEEEIYHSILLREQYRAMAEDLERELDAEEAEYNREQAYKKALEEILKSSTVGDMVRIADRVLKENKA